MRQISRLLRVLRAVLVHTTYLSKAARRLPLEERDRFRARRQQIGCKLLCHILGVRVTVEGTFPEKGVYLAVCNHFGVLDSLVLASQFPVSFAGNAEMGKWPLIGWVTREFGVIFVHRQRRSQAGSFVAQVQDKLRSGVTVLVFPEGTTHEGADIHPFKTGSFEAVAGLDGAQVLPLFLDVKEINGRPVDEELRRQVTWANSPQSFLEHFWSLLRIGVMHMNIRIGAPIPVDALNRKQLARQSHDAVRALQAAALPS